MSETYDPEVEALLGFGPTNLPSVIVREPVEPGMFAGGAFEGADRFSRELALWAPPIMSADQDIFEAKDETDARVRDLIRNDSLVHHGRRLHQDNVVGSQYMLNCKPETRILGLDDVWATEFQEEVETKFMLFAESPNNWLDAQRINTFTGLIRLAVGVHLAAGEVLSVAEWIRDDPLRLYKTAIQMVDLDRLSNPWGTMDSENIRRGIERDRRGAPIAYHIRKGHPTDFTNPRAYEWTRIPRIKPWGRLQVIHIYEQLRPDQTRGISKMVSVLKETKMGKKFRDLTLQNAAVQATYAASIESDLPSEAVYQALGAGNMGTTAMGEIITEYARAFLGAISEYAGSSKNMHLDGVKIPHLFPGTKLQLRPAGTPGGVGSDFEASLNRHLAANLDVSYEELTKDFTKTNYSGFKGGLNETRKAMASLKKQIADRQASAIYGLWFEEAMNLGELETMKGRETSFYEGVNKDAYLACDWIGASIGQIDELKETQAAALRVDKKLSTYEEEHGRLGKDWRRIFRQIKRERDLMKQLEIDDTEIDPNMMNAASGTPRDPDDPDPEEKANDSRPGDRADVAGEAILALRDEIRQTAHDHGRQMLQAVKALSMREDTPPVVNMHVQPRINVDVHTKANGKTQTRILAHDEKGRILATETVPVEEE